MTLREDFETWKLARGCDQCGYNKIARNLCFHHLDSLDASWLANDRNVSRSSNHHFKLWKTQDPELAKCALLCANCHGEVHAADLPRTRQLG